jgi:cytochrome c oxidase assembly factor CtaG/ferredoxin
MNPVAETIFRSWTPDYEAPAILLLTCALYARGWRRLRRRRPREFGVARLASFLSGVAAILLAVASPLDAFAGLLLTAHMIQHLLLLMVAPPLLLYGAPYLPILRGLPARVLRHGAGPFLASPELQWFGRKLTHPLVCWLAFTIASLTWHTPELYELALRSPFWHGVEHLCFLGAALLFWWPVIQPAPSRAQWPRWAMIPYLFLADFQNTALAAFLIFCDRAIYPSYAAAPRLLNLSPLEDQAAAGAVMWVPGSVAYLVPLGLLTIKALSSRRQAVRPPSRRSELPVIQNKGASTSFPAGRPEGWDLLSVPIVGAALGRPRFRRVVQSAMFALALAVIADGLFGHQMSSMNLAGTLPWTHWRGLAAISLLAAGNFFCMACPFTLTRDFGRRWMPARWRWPKRLRSKWLAAVLLAAYLWAYEVFSLWDSPWWTAWIVIGYFAASFVIDGLFRGASFCKYVCPLGQFNFAQSLVSPLEVKVRKADVCLTCATYDCIRGAGARRGCELGLFQPKKSGNLDCTFCLDCVHACPHQNVGIIGVMPGSQITHDRYRSALGRLSQRADVAALVLLLAFGAFVNAAGMIGPVVTLERALQRRMGLESLLPVTSALFVLALIVAPLLLVALCGVVWRALCGGAIRLRELACRFALTLAPLGFSMWASHLAYHFLIGAAVLIPAAQRAASDLGVSSLGRPNWAGVAPLLPLDWLPSLQILLLDGGLLLTLYASWRVARRFSERAGRALSLFVPWAVLAALLYAAGVWIVVQPMEMRGLAPGMQACPMSGRTPGAQR